MVFWINVSTEYAAWLLPIHMPIYIYIKREVYMYLSRGDLLEHRGKHQRPFNSTERYSMLKKRKKLVDKEKAIWMHGLKPKVNNYTFDFYSSSFIFFLCNLKSFKNSSLINQINRFPFKSNFRMANSSKTHFFPIICRNYVKWTVASSLYKKKGTVTLSLNNNLIY